MNIKQLIFDKWSELERQENRRITLKELSNIVGIEYTYFNHIYNMRRQPTQEQVEQLADHFQDLRFYDVVGMVRPDPMLKYLIREWGNFSKSIRENIANASGYKTKKDG